MTIIERLFRNIFFLIDDVIYNQIPKLYNLLITIAKTSPLSQANIADMASRIYKLLAVFMVFKVTLSLIMYVVNPDDFSDKSKGISKLITNIVISLAVLVLTPFIFSYGYQFQEIILKDNSLAAVVFGSELTKSKDIINDAGEQMAYLSITPFVTPNLTYFNCSSIYSADVNSKADLKYDCFGFNDLQEYIKSEEACTSNSALCSAARDNESNNSKYLTRDDVINYAAGISNNNFNYVFRKNLVTSYYYDTKDFAFDYSFIMSTVVGVMIALFLITSCMDIGLRSIKLAFLQLIAPIPILSYIDPKSGKDGMFKKWYQMALKTYLSLFIKILVIYFAVYIIGNLDRLVNVIDGSYVTNGYVKIFIMIGALMFAKNFTKILESLGVKLDGGFTLNPIKKFNEQMLGGKRITGAAGALVAGTADRAARLATSPWPQKLSALNPFTAIGQTVRGAASNGGFSGGMKAQANVNRRLREGRVKGLSPTAAYLDYFGSKFGLDDATIEKKGYRIRGNRERIEEGEREVAAANRANELEISKLKQQVTPAKALQSRRQSVQSSAKKLMDQAEKIAENKADIREDAFHENLNRARIEAMTKLRNGQALTTADNAALNSLGFGLRTSEKELLKKERELNSKKYTTNRRADSAAVNFLTDNQGQVLDHAVLVGEGDTQVVFEAGTMVDANVVASAQAAQGKYVKESKKAVYNHLADTDDHSYDSLSEQAAFTNDYDTYVNDKQLANQAIDEFNKNNNTNYSVFDVNARTYDDADEANNNITSSEDTTAINKILNDADQEIAKLTEENEKRKREKKVVYVDSQGKKHEYSLEEANSNCKPEEEELKRDREKLSNYRSILQSK